MFPLSDDNPTLRSPVVTHLLLILLAAVWVFVQGAGIDETRLAASVCKFGLIAGELTHRLAVGTAIPVSAGAPQCLVDSKPLNYLTPITSMFMHGSWMHILGNGWFLRIFGDNVEDCMGRFRFIVFYLLCGLAAAAAQVAIDPASAAPMIGASGAISGVMGAYVVLFPRVRVKTLIFLFIFIRIIFVPAWFMLLYWFGIQVFQALPQIRGAHSSSGVAVVAHVGGFIAGAVLVKLFVNKNLLAARAQLVAT
jgi:membrane associated rhomboid family serine protease